MSKIFITGATGHFGKTTIDFLLQKGVPANSISALVRDESKAADLKEKNIRLVKGDYRDYPSLVKAFAGVDKLLLVSSSDMVDRGAQHENVVKAAKEAGVKYVLYTSFARKVETAASPIAFVAQGHLQAEKSLQESGMPCTVFRNNIYLEYIPFFVGDQVLETKVIYLPAADGKGGFALRTEMAEAAANVLTSGGHEGKSYHISNTETYSYAEVAKTIGEITGKEIKHVCPSAEAFIQTLTAAGVPVESAQLAAAFAIAHAQGEFDEASEDLQNLLGRKPTTLKGYLKTVYGNN